MKPPMSAIGLSAMSSCARRGTAAHRCFTLLELVVVIAILCVVLGTAAVSVKKVFSEPSLEDIAEKIQVTAAMARRMAAAGGKIYQITYNQKNTTVYGVDGGIKIPDGIVLLPGGIADENNETTVIFSFRPDGTAGGDFVVLKERNDDANDGVKISASPLNGAITLKLPEDEE